MPPRQLGGHRFLLTHVWVPFGIAVVCLIFNATFDIDLHLADTVFAWEGNRWSLRHAALTDQFIHQLGHDLSVLAWLVGLAAWIWSCCTSQGQAWRKPLCYLLLSVAVATTLVAWVKSWSNMDCPWDLLRYGGERPFVGLFDLRPVGLERARCFPAGHASAGYAWLALYFFFAVVRPRWRWFGLCLGLAAGLVFGVSQQLRGAHFLSHDVWTFAICWGTAVALFYLFWPHSWRMDAGLVRDQAGQRA